MGAIPGGIDPSGGPPMAIPLRHFVVGLGFLLAAATVALIDAAGIHVDQGGIAFVHLFLVGWVCVTIMGAMTQFVPVWSGTLLHSRRLAVVQLWLVGGGVPVLVGAWLSGGGWPLAVGGTLMTAGFWTFVYNIGRSLLSARPLDVTERHFLVALGYFLVLTVLGLLLAASHAGMASGLPVRVGELSRAHLTVAVFGAVLTTVWGALYQLSTMFTQSEVTWLDTTLQRVEEGTYPIGVLFLATGRLMTAPGLARVGGMLVILGTAAAGAFLARRLLGARVGWNPMLHRYAVAVVGIAAWAIGATFAWTGDTLGPTTRFGGPGSFTLLAIGIVGFVVFGTLYHVIPFIVWVHRYSDELGVRAVPMIDDLYDDRLAAADLVFLLVGTGGLLLADVMAGTTVGLLGSVALAIGATLFVTNMVLVIDRHSPHTVGELVAGRLA